MSGFIIEKRTLGISLEETPYTAQTLDANDYNIAAYNVSYDGDIPMKGRKLVRGDFSRDPSVPGTREVKFTFSVDWYAQGTAQTPPNYFLALRACALKQTVHGSTGVSLVTNADYSNVPVTIEVVEKDEGTTPAQTVIKGRGCMGNAKLILDNVGEPVRIEFEFTGVLSSITDRAYAALISPSGISEVVPDPVLSSGITLFGEGRCINTFTIDLGNDVQNWKCPTYAEGFEGAHVVSRNPTLSFDPKMVLIATNGDYARWTAGTTGAFLAQVQGSISVSGPAAQIQKAYSPGEREGLVTNQETLEFKRSSGNDELKILQGAES